MVWQQSLHGSSISLQILSDSCKQTFQPLLGNIFKRNNDVSGLDEATRNDSALHRLLIFYQLPHGRFSLSDPGSKQCENDIVSCKHCENVRKTCQNDSKRSVFPAALLP